jgi:hypothetical protein
MKSLSFFSNRWLRKITIALIFLAGYFVFNEGYSRLHGLGFFAKSIPIEDVTEKVIITLSKKPGGTSRNRLSIKVIGELSGAAVIHQLYDGDKKAAYVIGPGKVRLKIDKEWEYPKCSLMYEPQNVVSGQLGIQYKFD